ncbi:MAG TPA: hypothetical protein VF487_07930 [Chitinophagaceae bacterium]
MRTTLIALFTFISLAATAQQERDTVLPRCPVYITDTVSANNYFLEFQPSTIRVNKIKGDLRIQVQQRDQFFTLFFADNKLKDGIYKIVYNDQNKNEVKAKYSFRSGASVSYVDLTKGDVQTYFDKEKELWRIRVNGMLANIVSNTITYYRVRADFYIH